MSRETAESQENLLAKIDALQNRLAEAEQLIDAIKAGEVDAFAVNSNDGSEVYTLQSGDYAYRILIEKFSEGAVNFTEDGLIVYTNLYFHELIGKPYEKVVGTSVFDLVHDDSKEKFNAIFNEALGGSGKGEINLRVNDKSVCVYVSLTSLQPKLPTVGMIVTDLTLKKQTEETIRRTADNLKAANAKLKMKNEELEQSNTELASFSYVASHDLQEPLRKIQTFSNRILAVDRNNFSAKTRDYFERMSAAALRMQSLIDALLNYSRASKTEDAFADVDLNALVDDVKKYLRETIEEKNAVVETEPLPKLHVIPHQFNQLFVNILGNAIKYAKPGVTPKVKVTAEKVSVTDVQLEEAYAHDSYWKISVADNGVGFEQQYANRIFELFQRLHSKTEYPGTGIGLAICKKILQNHQGFIKATGEPGAGSTFHIYVPTQHSA